MAVQLMMIKGQMAAVCVDESKEMSFLGKTTRAQRSIVWFKLIDFVDPAPCKRAVGLSMSISEL